MPAKRATSAKTVPAKRAAPSAAPPAADVPVIPFAGAKAWAAWLKKHHASSAGVWLKIAKAGSGHATVTYAEALDEALCHGWIDGQKRPFDAEWWLQKFTPRGTRSIWSQVNRVKVQVLIDAGRMQPAGQREIDRAKGDGRWERAYAPQSAAAVPDDLQAALDRNPKARAFFATLKGPNRYAVLFRVHNAKKAETRARRIAQFVAMLAKGETVYPQGQR